MVGRGGVSPRVSAQEPNWIPVSDAPPSLVIAATKERESQNRKVWWCTIICHLGNMYHLAIELTVFSYWTHICSSCPLFEFPNRAYGFHCCCLHRSSHLSGRCVDEIQRTTDACPLHEHRSSQNGLQTVYRTCSLEQGPTQRGW